MLFRVPDVGDSDEMQRQTRKRNGNARREKNVCREGSHEGRKGGSKEGVKCFYVTGLKEVKNEYGNKSLCTLVSSIYLRAAKYISFCLTNVVFD